MKIHEIKQYLIVLTSLKQTQIKGGNNTSTSSDSIVSGDIDVF